MTGLDPDNDLIIEIHCFITDGQLRLVDEGPAAKTPAGASLAEESSSPSSSSSSAGGDASSAAGWGAVVHVDQPTLHALMGPWCVDHHGRSGLTAQVLASTTTAEQAADGLLAYIQRFVPQPRVALLAGSSVHADRAFLRRPPYDRVLAHLHYRILDVSSLKEAVLRWAPPLPPPGEGEKGAKKPRKKGAHRAREDILDSIAEARYYKERFFS